MIELGVNIFVEVGPGKVLTGLMRQIDRSVRVLSVEDAATLHSTIEKITQARAEAPES
jgi:[acyl-carrier-protein] S-malonyltransferase